MSLSVSIHWCSLVPEQEEIVRSELRELSEKLKDRYPALPLVDICELTSSEKENLPEFISRQRGGFQRLNTPVSPLDGKRVFVFCKDDEPFVIKAKGENPMAVWGAAVRGDYALVWKPNNKYLLWHEAMHLLYAEDCYDSNGRTTCEESCCIMQYVPCEENCNGNLFLCSANVRRVCNFNV